jgi:hypothetical protein
VIIPPVKERVLEVEGISHSAMTVFRQRVAGLSLVGSGPDFPPADRDFLT